ncbi:hypothetical protein Plhal304r1_c040g0118801 [Plasmopara halstedii]
MLNPLRLSDELHPLQIYDDIVDKVWQLIELQPQKVYNDIELETLAKWCDSHMIGEVALQ